MTSHLESDPSVFPPEQHVVMHKEPLQFSIWTTFKRHIPRFCLTILVDLILPIMIYFLLQRRVKPVYALLISGTPPLIMVLIKGLLARMFDALGFLVFVAFLVSALVALITRNPIVLLLEKSVVTGILSILFAVTLLPLSCCRYRYQMRPLAYYFYQDLVPTRRMEVGLPSTIFDDENNTSHDLSSTSLSGKQEVARVYEWIYRHCSSFRSACYLITSIWSIGLLMEFLARLILILLHLSVNRIFVYGHIILTLITVLCIVLTVICIAREREQTLKFIQQWNAEHGNIATIRISS
jgi:hypothetical protein